MYIMRLMENPKPGSVLVPKQFTVTGLTWLTWALFLLSYIHQGDTSPVPGSTIDPFQGHLNITGSPVEPANTILYYAAGGSVGDHNASTDKNTYPLLSTLSRGEDKANDSSLTTELREVLVKPSQLTFQLNPFCEADVSLERVICKNLKNRNDLPKKQKTFEQVQRAHFINVFGEGNLELKHFQRLFPNLIVLSITESQFSTASLINLQSTSRSKEWELKASPTTKSLAPDFPLKTRINLNDFFASFGANGTQSVNNQSGIPLFPFRKLGSSPDQNGSQTNVTNDINSRSVQSEANEISGDVPMGDEPEGDNDEEELEKPHVSEKMFFQWTSVRHLILSGNNLTSEALPGIDQVRQTFPSLEQLDLSRNKLTKLDNWGKLDSIDISGNPLDCTNLEWVDNSGIKLHHANQTLCDQPPHQNKAKPIFKVLDLIKKVRDKCKVECSCDVTYIWEQNHIIYSKNVVNCSGRGLTDFPDPYDLPNPTYTLDLRNNNITSIKNFVDKPRYNELHLMNLYLDDNQITSINKLEGSAWFYEFQIFSIRRNRLSEVPVYVLENVLRQNQWLYQIDLSSNPFKCDCFTVSSYKVWLLKYPDRIGNIDDVRCASTNEQIRYMKLEEWCKVDHPGDNLLNILDLVSIILAVLIVVVIAKVYYDYRNFKTKGKLPWLVSKM